MLHSAMIAFPGSFSLHMSANLRFTLCAVSHHAPRLELEQACLGLCGALLLLREVLKQNCSCEEAWLTRPGLWEPTRH